MAAGAGQTPEAGSSLRDELAFVLGCRVVVHQEGVVECVKLGLIFVGQDDGFRGESVLQAVGAGAGFALCRAGSGGVLGIGAVASGPILSFVDSCLNLCFHTFHRFHNSFPFNEKGRTAAA